MREFLLYSNTGFTSGKFRDLMKAGRLDIVAHSIIHALYLSNDIRKDVKFHVILNGPPDPPKHIEIFYEENIPISKKDVGNLLKFTLWKYKKGRKVKAFPGIYIEKKSFEEVVDEMRKSKEIVYLDKNGESFREFDFSKDCLFVIGDHLGLPKEAKKYLRKINARKLSLGSKTYFSSQTIVILNFLIDNF